MTVAAKSFIVRSVATAITPVTSVGWAQVIFVQQTVLSAAVAMLHGAAAQSADEPTVAKKPAPHSTSVTAFAVDPSVFAAQVATAVQQAVLSAAVAMLHGAAAQAAYEPTVAKKPAPHSTSVTAFPVDPPVFVAHVAGGGVEPATLIWDRACVCACACACVLERERAHDNTPTTNPRQTMHSSSLYISDHTSYPDAPRAPVTKRRQFKTAKAVAGVLMLNLEFKPPMRAI